MKRRSLLAALWSIVGLLTLTSFVIAIVFACASENYDSSSSSNNNNNGGGGGGGSADDRQQNSGGAAGSAISVTSRAMVFAAIWTAVLSGILVVYGTVILGIHVPITGKYYACCRGNVHRMTPISLGAFGGSLLMFANLTLVFAILFGEFEIRDFNFAVSGRQGGGGGDDYVTNNTNGNSVVHQSSFAFSIMCIFFTIMYAAFACVIFRNAYALLEESVVDARIESLYDEDGDRRTAANSAPGYIGGDRFGVVGRSYGEYGRGEKPIEVL